MKKSFSVMVAIVLIASMSLLAFAACVTDDECRHSAMQCIGAVDATCVENGNIEYWYCIDCGKCFSDFAGENEIAFGDTVIAATGEHDWSAWVTDSESSCTTGGTRHRVCSVCGERQDETLPVGKHDLNFVKAVEATCTEEGNVAHWHCSECGKNYSDEEATEVLNDVTTPKAAHDTTFVEAQAHTCTDDGNIAYWHCGACGHNFADEDGEQEIESVVDPAAHAWGEWEQTSDPTCTERGVLTRVCEVCFDEEYDYIDELGHDFENAEWAYNDANHWHLCNRCGAASQRELQHEYDAEGVCVCGMIEYAPTSEFRFISLGGYTWSLANYTGTRRNVSIPSTYNGGTVVAISDNAFAGNTSMETLVVPETVTSIGAEAFADCANLKNLTMSSKVTTIGDNAFDGCDAIETASIPANAASYISKVNLVNLTVTNGAIEEYAFASSPKLASVEVAGETSSIGRRAFSGCSGLTSVTIGNSVTSIGDWAFSGCSGLTSVTIGNSVTSIGNAFGGVTAKIEWGDNPQITSIGRYTFSGYKGSIITIPDSVTSIGEQAFVDCTDLTSVTIPDSVTSIDSWAFYGCSGLTDVYYQGDLSGWLEIDIAGGYANPMYYADNLYINGKLLQGDIVIPDGTEKIGIYAFGQCSGLTSVTIPDSVTSIGGGAFSGCSGLTSVTIPDSVTSIGGGAFSGCSGLESITIPFVGGSRKTAKDADQYPFGYIFGETSYSGGSATEQRYYGSVSTTGSLTITSTTYYIPTSLKSVTVTGGDILYGAFYDCDGLTSVTIEDGVTSIDYVAFYDCDGLTSVTIEDGVTRIGSDAFRGCSGLTSIVIPNSVTRIGSDAFSYCYGLTSVTIGTGVTSIGSGAFLECYGLTDVYYQGDLSGWLGIEFDYVAANPMHYADNLYINGELLQGDIGIPGGTKKIGAYAFYGCSGLTSVTIPDSVTSIGEDAFRNCSGLTSITIPDSVTSIGEEAFNMCNNLTDVHYQGDLKEWLGIEFATPYYTNANANPMSEADNLYINGELLQGDIVIPDGTEKIGDYAFYNCSGLTSIVIPDSVTSIGDGAFYWCSGLTSITIPDSVTSIGEWAFYYCTDLTTINFQGTKAQWRAIEKANGWDSNTGTFTVICTDDGTIS